MKTLIVLHLCVSYCVVFWIWNDR